MSMIINTNFHTDLAVAAWYIDLAIINHLVVLANWIRPIVVN